jgi:hypothetical protein
VPLSTRSTLAEYVAAMWFPICVAVAVVPRAVNAAVVSGIILVGLTLLTYEKDRRYPQFSWSTACRRFYETHEWSSLFVWVTALVAFYTQSHVSDDDPRGLCVIAATAYVLLTLAAPARVRIAAQSTCAAGDGAEADES